MNIKDLTEKFDLTVLSAKEQLSTPITGGYCSDLLSDVMGKAKEGQVWITMQSHKNIIAVASLKELAAIIVVGGNTPKQDTIEQAEQENIPLLATTASAFDTCGKIYGWLHENL